MLICDCTLRDGGYYTNWDFEKHIVERYLRTMEKISSIDVLEVGYRNKPAQEYYGEYFYCPKYFLKEVKLLAPSKKIAIMLNEKNCTINDLEELLNPCQGLVDIVRLAVNPDNYSRALKLAKAIKEMGFEIAFNLMYLSTWSNNEFFIKKLNQADGIVDFLYLVDSYGSMQPKDITKAIIKIKEQTKTPLGFHGHNNLELALINTITAIENGAEFADCTVTGMGRGAGNLKTELLLTYLNSNYNKEIDFSAISELISVFEEMQEKCKWGTNLPYMISGAFSLPQAEVMNWISKHRYTISSIVLALQNKKDNVEDNLKLEVFSQNKKYDEVIIIGGGSTSLKTYDAIQKYVNNKNIGIIMAGGRFAKKYLNIENDKYFCLVGAEANKFEDISFEKLKNQIFIVPPHPRPMGTILPDHYGSIYELKDISFTLNNDSLLGVALEITLELDVNKVTLVGFDGYDIITDYNMQEVANENQKIIDDYILFGKKLCSFTPTKYQNIKQESIYSYL